MNISNLAELKFWTFEKKTSERIIKHSDKNVRSKVGSHAKTSPKSEQTGQQDASIYLFMGRIL